MVFKSKIDMWLVIFCFGFSTIAIIRVTCKSVWLRINSCESKQEELSIYNTSQLCSKLLDFSI